METNGLLELKDALETLFVHAELESESVVLTSVQNQVHKVNEPSLTLLEEPTLVSTDLPKVSKATRKCAPNKGPLCFLQDATVGNLQDIGGSDERVFSFCSRHRRKFTVAEDIRSDLRRQPGQHISSQQQSKVVHKIDLAEQTSLIYPVSISTASQRQQLAISKVEHFLCMLY